MGAVFKLHSKGVRRLRNTLLRAPKEIKQNVKRRWNVTALDFRRLMQDMHLSGGTTEDRLQRVSSNLYNSLKHEVTITREIINVSVWFIDTVKDYAPTHEHGDPSRNIPARMNLGVEWRNYITNFIREAEEGVEEGLRNA